MITVSSYQLPAIFMSRIDMIDMVCRTSTVIETEMGNGLGISHQTIYKLIKEGPPSHKIGEKLVFLKEDLVKWMKEH